MPRGVLVTDVKLLTGHYLRQQHGRDITVEGPGAGFKSLAGIAIPLFKRGAKAVGKKALQQMLVKTCWKGKCAEIHENSGR